MNGLRLVTHLRAATDAHTPCGKPRRPRRKPPRVWFGRWRLVCRRCLDVALTDPSVARAQHDIAVDTLNEVADALNEVADLMNAGHARHQAVVAAAPPERQG